MAPRNFRTETSPEGGGPEERAVSPDGGGVGAAAVPAIPPRAELWRRVRLARACLDHGRVNRVELMAILDGATLHDLTHDRNR